MPERGMRCNDALIEWWPLVHEWMTLIEAYTAAVPDDVPYHYSERTSIGLLGAAVWRVGGVALQDYLYDPDKNWSNASKEWGDLCIVIKETMFLVETKVDWYLQDPSLREYWSRLELAKSEAKSKIQVPNTSALIPSILKRVAVVFSSPQTPQAQDDSGLKTKLRALEAMFESGELDLLAWCCPYSDSTPFKSDPNQQTWYPGVILTATDMTSREARDASS